LQDGVLVPAFVHGKNSDVFASLRIPVGEGLSGWVALNRRSVLNGNPCLEPGYPKDSEFKTLKIDLLSVKAMMVDIAVLLQAK
jgi:hypothetical protein